MDGAVVGSTDGDCVGSEVGPADGDDVVGSRVGSVDGDLGMIVGDSLGAALGSLLGDDVGSTVYNGIRILVIQTDRNRVCGESLESYHIENKHPRTMCLHYQKLRCHSTPRNIGD